MKTFGFVLLLTICAIDCRKVVPINKNANIDFINMESGGGARPVGPARPSITPQKVEPPKTPVEQPKPVSPVVTTLKPVAVTVPAIPTPSKPVQPRPAQGYPNQKPVEVKPGQAPTIITPPASGNVKQLITYYDSKGQASVIRPYSYSQAVKQG